MATIDTPTYPQYTNIALGEGLFDQLMEAGKAHIKHEYDEQRIRGDLYAKTYLGLLESVLANSTQYLLGIMLIDEKRDQLQLQNDLLELQKEELRFKIDYLYPLERDKLALEVDKLAAEIVYMQKQGELIDSQILLHTSQIEVNDAQILKIGKEVEYLTAKIMTERANVENGIAGSTSLIGKQISLLTAQRIGFAGDIQTKTAKLHADYDAVFQTVQETPENVTLQPNAITAITAAEGYAGDISALT